MNEESRNLWDWPAFGYVGGEMTDEERRLFEIRLSDDEAACDAVVRAVELREAIRLAAREPFVAQRSAHGVVLRHRMMWAVALAACAVLAVVVWRGASDMPRSNDESAKIGEPRREAPSVVEPGLSLAWAERRNDDANSMSEDSSLSWFEATAVTELQNTQPDVESMEAADATVPQWLLTAVSSSNAQAKEIP